VTLEEARASGLDAVTSGRRGESLRRGKVTLRHSKEEKVTHKT